MRRLMCISGLIAINFLLVVACTTPSTVEEPQTDGFTVYEGARLIVGDGSEPIEDATFIVENGQFTGVGPTGQLNVPAGAARVDLTGKTVMPAIVDAHKHISNDRDEMVDQLQRLAYYGVTMVTSLGQDAGDLALEVRQNPIPDAARLLTAGRGLTAPEPGRSEVPYWITTEDEARTAIQELAARQVDLVKIWVDDRNGMYEKLSPALYGAVIDEAHNANLRVTAHLFTLQDAKGLLRAGLDGFAHGIRDRDVDDEVMELFQERPDFFLVPNLPDRGVAVDMSWLSGTLPSEEVARLQAASTDRPEAQEFFGIQARNLARLNAAGVQIALGTDGSTDWAPHVEMVDMVAAGMTPAEVIVAATRNAAEIMQVTDVGIVETGRSADFIVLNANPLDDIMNTREIDAVYLRGSAIDRAAMSARWTGQASQ